MNNKRLVSLLFVLCSLLIVSCDVLTNPKMDLFQQISDEVDWSNAAKLTVRIEYPPAWGMSSPAQGTITKDIRKGYAFDIEFTPDVVWTFDGWRAYRSPLPANWTIDTTLLDDLTTIDGVSVEVPNGEKGSFIINTTEAVTLVPWCKSEPYVTRTIPRNSETDFDCAKNIVIYFNTPLDLPENEPLASLFTTDKMIRITANGTLISVNNNYYNYPEYTVNADGTYTITIKPSNVPYLADKNIEVTVGDQIKNKSNDKMSKEKVFSFSTESSSITGSITSWEASYTGNTITVSWVKNGTDDVKVKMRYRVNQGADSPSYDTSPATIRNVSEPDASGVRQGRSVTNIREYEIFLDLYIKEVKSNTESKSFKIWNFPGMEVSNTSPAVEISDTAQLGDIRTSGLGNANKKYVLVDDVVVSGAWTPIGSSTTNNAFQGKFYGAGHTITLNGGFSGANVACGGVFGYAQGSSTQNALIRDLTVVYADTAVIGASTGDTYIGGIVGYANQDTAILNCMVKGADETATLAVTVYASGTTINGGGVVGYLLSRSYVQNCRAALNVKISSYNSCNANIGGVFGYYSPGRDTGTKESREITSVGQVTLGHRSGGSPGSSCGGIAGYIPTNSSSNRNKLSDCVFGGKITVPSAYVVSSDTRIGGIVGRFEGVGDMDGCLVTGDITVSTSPTGTSANLYLGGVIGYVRGGATWVIISNSSYSGGKIRIDSGSTFTTLYAGGFAGSLRDYSDIQNCRSLAESVTVQSTDTEKGSGKVYIGGFAGEINYTSVSACSSTSPVIVPASHQSTGAVSAGGFAGAFLCVSGQSKSITKCFSTGSVTVYSRNTAVETTSGGVGGFVGIASYTGTDSTASNTISQCYATGNVTAWHNASPAGSDVFGFRVGGLVGLAIATEIKECYATGNVTASKISAGTMPVVAGGLVGFLGCWTSSGTSQNSSVTNCYATGDVTADNPNSNIAANVYTGGLVGYAQIVAGNSVTSSFASGTVSAKNNASAANVWAGGVVGYKASGQLLKCVAAGRPDKTVSVSAQGGSARYVGRVYGQSAGTAPANNYANNAIFTGTSVSYFDNPTLAIVSGTPAAADADGETKTNADLSSSSFWTTSGFTGAWNFGSVAQGYPKLAWEK